MVDHWIGKGEGGSPFSQAARIRGYVAAGFGPSSFCSARTAPTRCGTMTSPAKDEPVASGSATAYTPVDVRCPLVILLLIEGLLRVGWPHSRCRTEARTARVNRDNASAEVNLVPPPETFRSSVRSSRTARRRRRGRNLQRTAAASELAQESGAWTGDLDLPVGGLTKAATFRPTRSRTAACRIARSRQLRRIQRLRFESRPARASTVSWKSPAVSFLALRLLFATRATFRKILLTWWEQLGSNQ